MTWHILTGEYPPQGGGVSTYTRQVACGLAQAGDEVVVWAPPAPDAAAPDPGVVVNRLPDRFGRRSLRLLGRALDRERTAPRLLVQYVPHAFGWKAANLPFCAWIAARRRERVWIMFHEVAFPFDAQQAPWLNVLAAVNRVMARMLVRSAERIFVSIPGWRSTIEALADRETPIVWLPVPSGVRVVRDPAASAAVRARYGDGRPIAGHFGTHGSSIRALLADAIPAVVRANDGHVLLMGPRSDEVRREAIGRDPSLASRVHSTGPLAEEAVSAHIVACDLMLQPYPDGISTRRTSAMAALAHGVPVVTTIGWLTEPLWRESEAVALAPAGDAVALAGEAARLLASTDARMRLGDRGRHVYESRFDLVHTLDALREDVTPARSAVCA